MRVLAYVVSVMSLLLLATVARSQPTEYNFITINVDFPSFPDDLFGCAATGINDEGLVVGGCNDLSQNSNLRGFLYDGRRFSEIDFHHTKTDTLGARRNIQSEGLSLLARSVYQSAPFHDSILQRPGILRSMRPIVSGVSPQDINNQDHVTGWYFDGTRLQGFLKRNGNVLKLTVPKSQLTEAIGINDIDQIVGDYRDQNGFFHGFLYQDGIYSSIDVPFIPSFDTGAFGINNLGEIVGCYSLCSRGFLHNSERSIFTRIDIPGAVVTQASDINDLGQIVGTYSSDGLTVHGFLYDGSGFTLIDVPGSVLTDLFGINNAGQVVGFYVVEKPSGVFEAHAFVGTPIEK